MNNGNKYLNYMKNFLRKYGIALGHLCIPLVIIISLVIFYESRSTTDSRSHNAAIERLETRYALMYDEMRMFISEIMQSKHEMEREHVTEHRELIRAHTVEVLELTRQYRQADEDRRRFQEFYWENVHVLSSLGLRCFDAPLILHEGADMTLVNLIIEHFDALFAGDEERFMATISDSEWSQEFMMWRFYDIQRFRRYRTKVKFIPSAIMGYRAVFILVQNYEDSEPELQWWPVAIGYYSGRWFVFDHH